MSVSCNYSVLMHNSIVGQVPPLAHTCGRPCQ